MHRAHRVIHQDEIVAAGRAGAAARRLWCMAAALLALLWCGWAAAAGISLRDVELGRSDDGVLLSFTAGFELPKTVEEALLKGVPLHFEAEARIYRSRWYWRDQRVVRAGRTWRLAYQPLTRRYRVTFGSFNQNYDTLEDALAAIQRTTRWRIADLSRFEPGERHYIELDFRLDTSQLPRPFQIGIGGEDEWDLSAESTLVMDDPT